MEVQAGSWRYFYARRRVVSTFPLPELPQADDARASIAPTFHVEQLPQAPQAPGNAVAARNRWPDPQGNIAIHGERWQDGSHCLHFPELASILISASGERLGVWRHPGASEAAARHLLLDQALPRALALQGTLVLHGSAVTTPGGRLLVFLGESGRGKSTLATGFDLYGGMALTDDCMALDCDADAVRAFPGYPGLRLWPDSLEALLEHRRSDAIPVAHYSSKQRLPPAALSDHIPQHAIDAFVVLQAADGRGEVTLTAQTRQQACMALVANSFQLDPADLRHIHRLLGIAADATARVPVFALQHPRDYAVLPEVVARISAHFDGGHRAGIDTH